ncbi:hypothetical protein LTR62_005829 [Meristemomyces frigidus]|uniref:Radical SAM core domain-containing protein n=1 Tax=Meristemomyces frigidus TaxID=1508187 RepID=A0AAN7TD29_9PEZI|nr:hypothetical protein LTR62_005829 [Meristemomyces frigidus]
MATPYVARTAPRAIRRTRWTDAVHTQSQTRRLLATAAAIEQHEPAPFVPDLPPPTAAQIRRRDGVKEAKPFSDFLTDNYARQHDYLRISLTERCNLRCLYCMPEEGIQLQAPSTQLTTAEVFYLSQLFVSQGVNKIRLTGGEPTVRKDIVPLMQRLGSLRSAGLKELALTTNGISLWRKLDAMAEAGLTGVNISLDTLDPFQFQLLTRRQGFDAVMKSINRVQEMNRLGAAIKLKINCVVMRGLNDHQILPFVEMTREQDVEVRFIEYMPFGGNKWSENKMFPYQEMLDLIRTKFPEVERLRDKKNDTSKTWQVPGFVGRVGFITSMTHNFCGSCNRLRITSDGNLKVCLHGETEVSLRDLLRKDHEGAPMNDEAFDAIRQIELDGRKDSAAALGLRFDGEEGWLSKERQLLDVIGAAVKRKKAKHAGIGQLENMKNRPMILIGGSQDGKPSFASGFGFQSLSGLFQEEPRGRYSRPKVSEEERIDTTSLVPGQVAHSGKDNVANSQTSDSIVEENFFQPTTVALGQPGELNGNDSAASPTHHSNASSSLIKKHPGKWNVAPKYRNLPPLTDAERQQYLREGRCLRCRELGHMAMQKDLCPLGGSLQPLTDAERQRYQRDGICLRCRQPGHSAAQKDVCSVGRLEQKGGLGDLIDSTKAPDTVRVPAFRSLDLRQPNPFVVKGRETRSFAGAVDGGDEQAWGMSSSGETQMGILVDGGESIGALAGIRESIRVEHQTLAGVVNSSTGTEKSLNRKQRKQLARKAKADQLQTPPEDAKQVQHVQNPIAPKLTHLTSSGEAHMVDVGAKQATRRVAVATGRVCFDNPTPFKLILENSNKKGDVLGVARIAGIMAAKRTSDLIPLCHPIPITKVEVEVHLIPPNKVDTQIGRLGNNKFGLVVVQVVVETFGPTGVEMEALTAVSGACLTVYDMCKAVDRDMIIGRTGVVYKAGGRSGTHVLEHWAVGKGREWFSGRGLEVPDLEGLKGP